jgi:hypothetical protein
MSTVNMKPKPQPIASNRSKRLSKTILEAKLGDEYSNSEVTSRIIAVTASHKPMSPIERGKFIFSP